MQVIIERNRRETISKLPYLVKS